MIHVCDAIMGTGKTSAAITYMNEHAGDKFIYIAPFLDEASRIKEECPLLSFIEPSFAHDRVERGKVCHTAKLIKDGSNIATTHAAFTYYTPDMLDDIRERGYTLIIDEDVEVLESMSCHPGDLQLAVDAGYITHSDGAYSLTDKEYTGFALSGLFRNLRSRELFSTPDGAESLFYWVLSPELLTSFKDVFILTYLFEGQNLYYFMQMYNIGYEYIGINRADMGGGAYSSTFKFGELPGYVPEYVSRLSEMIDVYEGRMNWVGDDFFTFSSSWFDRRGARDADVKALKSNIRNYFNKVIGAEAGDAMWSSFMKDKARLTIKGYPASHVPFNQKATNAFRNKTCMAYVPNIFTPCGNKIFYSSRDINVDDKTYALSAMVQWIWRSAIRDGKQVHIYLPSRRMREILYSWIDKTMKGGVANA